MNALQLALIIALGGFGILIGSFLNAVIWRVPRGESLLPASRCPHCGARIRPWHNVPLLSWIALRGRCADCRSPISARYPLVELATGAAFAAVTWWWLTVSAPGGPLDVRPAVAAAWWLALAAYLWLAAASLALALIDLEHRRLPVAIVLPTGVAVLGLFSGAALLTQDWPRLVSTLSGSAILFALYLVIALIAPRGIGGGDVKLAPVLGAPLGFLGWGALAVGGFAGFLLGALAGLVLIAAGRATRRTALPFGPFMLMGAWFGLVAGPWLMAAYLSLWAVG